MITDLVCSCQKPEGGSRSCWMMSVLIKMFLTGAAWTGAQRGRGILSSLTTISLACLERGTFFWRKHHRPISQAGERIYTGYKERQSLSWHWCSVFPPVPAGWQSVYLLLFLVVPVFTPQTQFQHWALSPHLWVSLSCLPRRFWAPSRAMGSRAPCSPGGTTPGSICFGAFLEESSDCFLILSAKL